MIFGTLWTCIYLPKASQIIGFSSICFPELTPHVGKVAYCVCVKKLTGLEKNSVDYCQEQEKNSSLPSKSESLLAHSFTMTSSHRGLQC